MIVITGLPMRSVVPAMTTPFAAGEKGTKWPPMMIDEAGCEDCSGTVESTYNEPIHSEGDQVSRNFDSWDG